MLGRVLSRFEALVDWTFQACVTRPWTTVLAFLVATVALTLALAQMKIELSIYELVDPNFPGTARLQEMRRDFGDGNTIMLFVGPAQSGARLTGRQLCSIRDWGLEEWGRNREVIDVASPFDLRESRFIDDRHWYPNLLVPDCDSDAPADLEVLKGSPWQLTMSDEKLRDVALQFTFRDSAVPGAFGRFDPGVVGEVVQSAEKRLLARDPSLTMRMNGESAFSWHFQRMLMRDFLLNLMILVVLVVFFRVFYGTWKSGLLFSLTLVMTGAASYGAMALLGSPLDLLTNNLFLMNCVAGIEDFLFVIYAFRRAGPGASQKTLIGCFRRLAVPAFFTSLTTMIGFGSLVTSDLTIIRRFGLWAAWAVFAEWATTFLFLPALIRLFPEGTSWVGAKAPLQRQFARLESFAAPGWMRWAGTGLFALGVAGFFFLNYDENPTETFRASHPHSKSFQYLRETRGWESMIFVVFPSRVAVVEAGGEKGVRELLARVAQDPNVRKVDDSASVEDFLTRDHSEGDTRMVKWAFHRTDAYRKYVSERGQIRAAVYLKDSKLSEVGRTIAAIDEVCRGRCHASGESAVLHEFSLRVSRTLVESFIVSVLLVSLILCLLARALGQWPSAWKLVYSSIWSPVVMIGAIAVFQVQVNLITSIFAAVIVGLTGDNAIQYLFASRDRELSEGIHERAGATVQLLLLLSLSSLIFLGASMVPIRTLGILFATGFFVTLAGDLWLLKGLLKGPLGPAHQASESMNGRT
ncbi:MAG TPA: hypothetical protein VM598_05175 [Bdellovibrionota bacterium]|nr:hypothetical protein [Bdellovibrionota bacterium]